MIGSPSKLGEWKAQGGLKLNYTGESVWQGSCVLQKDDFPITYPFSFSCLYLLLKEVDCSFFFSLLPEALTSVYIQIC